MTMGRSARRARDRAEGGNLAGRERLSEGMVVEETPHLEPARHAPVAQMPPRKNRLQFLSPCAHAKHQSSDESYAVGVIPVPKRSGPGMAVRNFGHANRQG